MSRETRLRDAVQVPTASKALSTVWRQSWRLKKGRRLIPLPEILFDEGG